MKPLVAFAIIAFWAAVAGSVSKIPTCESRPDLISQGRLAIPLKSLPRVIFVGKSADYYVESKTGKLRLWGTQSFLKGASRLVCATAGNGEKQSFSMYAPTLIDLTDNKQIGDSYWQFHVIENERQFGIWNKKSRLFSKSKDLEEGLSKIGAQAQFFQISHDEYEMVLTRETDLLLEVLAIRFETATGL